MNDLQDAARLLGKRGGLAGKGRPKRITAEEKARRAERMRKLRLVVSPVSQLVDPPGQ